MTLGLRFLFACLQAHVKEKLDETRHSDVEQYLKNLYDLYTRWVRPLNRTQNTSWVFPHSNGVRSCSLTSRRSVSLVKYFNERLNSEVKPVDVQLQSL